MIKFKTTKRDNTLIMQIVDRLVARDPDYPRQDAEMDLTACHLNGCPLDLEKLLAAPEADFGHDIYGIRRFIDRSTGELTGHFDPRCSLPF